MLNADPSASLATIATTAGVGRATLHRYFSGRSELIHALALQATEEIDNAANQAAKNALSHADALHRIMRAIIPLGDRHGFLTREAVDDLPDIHKQQARQKKEFINLIKAARKEGLFHVNCPVQWIASTYDHLIHAAWVMVREEHATQAQAAELAWQTLVHGLKKTQL